MQKLVRYTLLTLLILALVAPSLALAAVKTRLSVRVGNVHHRHTHYRHQVRPVQVVKTTRVNYGTVDFNVQPQKSKIYVDGHYLGIADQFNGYPQTATLPAGYHSVRVVSPGGENGPATNSRRRRP